MISAVSYVRVCARASTVKNKPSFPRIYMWAFHFYREKERAIDSQPVLHLPVRTAHVDVRMCVGRQKHAQNTLKTPRHMLINMPRRQYGSPVAYV